MKNSPITRLLVLLLLALTSCEPSGEIPSPAASDFEFPLTNGYILSRTDPDHIQIHPDGGWDDKTPMVYTKVVEVAWDDRWILAKRQQLRMDNVFDFWILDTKEKKLYGPINETSFAAKRKDLNVSAGLELKDVYSYKHSQ